MHDHVPLSTWVNFGVLVALLVFTARKPIAAALLDRRNRVKKAVDEAEELRASVEKMVREYEAKLADLDAEVRRILDEAKDDGERERMRILERAKLTAEKIRKDAVLRSAKEAERMRRHLQAEVVEEAVKEAMEVLRRKTTEVEHRRFTTELISELERSDGGRR